MTEDSDITGIVLAGGKSLRMGTDKGLMIFRDKPLVQYSLELLSFFCDRILISSNSAEYNVFGYEVVADKYENAGPMAGIAACLEKSNTKLNLILSCDMPFAEQVVFHTLLHFSDDFTFVVPLDTQGRVEPLCALYKQSSLAIMHQLLALQNYRMTELFKLAPVRMVLPDEYSRPFQKKWFMNFNSNNDLEMAVNI